MKIIHLSDTHIFNKKFHEEYKIIFNNLYNEIKKLKPDIIVHTGDIAHSKVNLSPEYFSICEDFLFNLQSLAPTYIILGNHDTLVKNNERMDAITPVVDSIKKRSFTNQLYLLRNSQEIILDNFVLNALSIIDEKNWITKPTHPEKINIALYHGSISGCQTDSGFIIENGESKLDLFKHFDFCLLGDIHKTNQKMDKEGRIRYAGSTTQTNFGESDDKGFLFWDIRGKNDFDVKHIHIPNPRPFVSIFLTKNGKIEDETYIPNNARLRLVSQSLISSETENQLLLEAKKRFNPYSLTFSNGNFWSDNSESISLSSTNNLRDIKTQEKLIKEFLKDYKLTKQQLDELFKLNEYYNNQVLGSDISVRNIKYNIEYFEWNNLLCFGENNKIDFTKLHDITGLFGKNFSGKSSVIDALIFTIFNSIPKNSRKSVNIINNKKDKASSKVHIRNGNKLYIIERTLQKYEKNLKGIISQEANTDVTFQVKDLNTNEIVNLTQEKRSDTDKEIRKYFGNLQDFLLTSLSWQFGSFNFIDEGSTERNKILSRFMDIDFFHKKFELAKEESKFLKHELQKFENHNSAQEIQNLNHEKFLNEKKILVLKQESNDLKQKTKKEEEKLNSLKESLASIKNIHSIDVSQLKDKQQTIEKEINDLKENLNKEKISLAQLKDKQQIIEKEKNKINFNFEDYKNKSNEYNELNKNKSNLNFEKKNKLNELEQKKKKLKILDNIPCGETYLESCKFIKDAAKAKKEINNFSIQEIENQIKEYQEKIDKLNFNNYTEEHNKNLQLNNEFFNLEQKINNIEKDINNIEKDLKEKNNSLEETKKEIKFYEQHSKDIENLNLLLQQIENQKKHFFKIQDEFYNTNDDLISCYQKQGSIEEKIKNEKQLEQEIKEKRSKYEIYELFMNCYKTKGLTSLIIKNNLNILNNEIQKILQNINNLTCKFEFYDNKLYIDFIKDNEKIPIEMCSGAEKTLSAFAIRLALTKLTTLPKFDIFILDEPVTSLDEDNMEYFINILEVLKQQFNTVILISHLELLKDSSNQILTINKNQNFSHLSY